MFSNLDNFLSGNTKRQHCCDFLSLLSMVFLYLQYFFTCNRIAKDEFKVAETDSSKTSFEAANDSWLDHRLDSSDSCNFKIETKEKGTGKVKDDDDDDDVTAKETSYVPVKGQKTAAKRLKKYKVHYYHFLCVTFSYLCINE